MVIPDTYPACLASLLVTIAQAVVVFHKQPMSQKHLLVEGAMQPMHWEAQAMTAPTKVTQRQLVKTIVYCIASHHKNPLTLFQPSKYITTFEAWKKMVPPGVRKSHPQVTSLVEEAGETTIEGLMSMLKAVDLPEAVPKFYYHGHGDMQRIAIIWDLVHAGKSYSVTACICVDPQTLPTP